MKKVYLVISASIFLASFSALAKNTAASVPVAGSAEVNISFDANEGSIMYSGSAVDIYGFAYEAQSELDKKNQQAGLENFEKKVSQFVQFDPALKCQWVSARSDHRTVKGHTEITGLFDVKCEKSPAGSVLRIETKDFVPSLKSIKLSYGASGMFHKNVVIKTFPGEIKFKK